MTTDAAPMRTPTANHPSLARRALSTTAAVAACGDTTSSSEGADMSNTTTRTEMTGVNGTTFVALRLAARHADQVGRVIAAEPPLAGIIRGGAELSAQITQPVDEHLADDPDDFVGAQAMLLTAIVGSPISADDPAFADARTNAEPVIREPNVTLASLTADDVGGRDITLALGAAPNDLIVAAAGELAAFDGIPTVEVEGSHEVYLTDQSVLTGLVAWRI